LVVTYEGLIAETTYNEYKLIQFLEKLYEEISTHKKKTTLFASRQGNNPANLITGKQKSHANGEEIVLPTTIPTVAEHHR